jgi:hypothetical protein
LFKYAEAQSKDQQAKNHNYRTQRFLPNVMTRIVVDAHRLRFSEGALILIFLRENIRVLASVDLYHYPHRSTRRCDGR